MRFCVENVASLYSLSKTCIHQKRATETGRVVPESTLDEATESTLEEAMQEVPLAIETPTPLADFFCEIDNSQDFGDITLKPQE